jgi:N-acetylmuramoyl-L-alanine amidase
MLSKDIYYLIILPFLALGGINPAIAEDGRMPTILLDPGHTPEQQGALGIRGIYEVVYNDHFVSKLVKALRSASFTVNLTRQPDQSISLIDRVAIANNGQSELFLSIHHDSAQPIYLKKINLEHGYGYQAIKQISGYSIFVSKTNSQFANSYRFAEILGQLLLKLGRPPTLHHAEDISGEHRELLNERLGIYRFDDLVVLAKTKIPAVLLEIGVIVDPDDEHYVSVESNQDAMCQAIVQAIQAYVGENPVTSN